MLQANLFLQHGDGGFGRIGIFKLHQGTASSRKQLNGGDFPHKQEHALHLSLSDALRKPSDKQRSVISIACIKQPISDCRRVTHAATGSFDGFGDVGLQEVEPSAEELHSAVSQTPLRAR